jgi:uncharacterized protein YbbC (DUF1343 family)
MRSLDAALLYPGLVLLESNTNLSLGRGTDAPFSQIGADWIQGQPLAEYLNAQFIPGVRVYPTRFTPTASHFEGKAIEGVRFVITDRQAFDSTRLGVELAAGLEKLYPGKLDFSKDLKLMGNKELIEDLKADRDASFIEGKLQKQAKEFVERRQPYLLY